MMAPSTRTWTKSETYKLIELYQSNSILWDFRRADHKDKSKRNYCLMGIAKVFGTTPQEIHRKLHNMKGQFFQELKKLKIKKMNGLDDNYEPSWGFFHYLKFLDLSGAVETTDTLSQNIIDISEQETNISFDSIMMPETAMQRRQTSDRAARKNKEAELLEKCQQILDSKMDEDQVFGDYVASVLRNMIDKRNKKWLKIMIQKSLLQIQEMDGENNENIQSEGDCSSVFSQISTDSSSNEPPPLTVDISEGTNDQTSFIIPDVQTSLCNNGLQLEQ